MFIALGVIVALSIVGVIIFCFSGDDKKEVAVVTPTP
jgi:hypothetical protein